VEGGSWGIGGTGVWELAQDRRWGVVAKCNYDLTLWEKKSNNNVAGLQRAEDRGS